MSGGRSRPSSGVEVRKNVVCRGLLGHAVPGGSCGGCGGAKRGAWTYVVWVLGSHRNLLRGSESGQRQLSQVVLEKGKWLPGRFRSVLGREG